MAPPRSFSSDDSDDGRKKKKMPENDAWTFTDEVLILEALVDMSDLEGNHPDPTDLHAALDGRVMREKASPVDFAKKKYNLKIKFRRTLDAGGPQGGERNQKLFELSKKVWPNILNDYPHMMQ